MTRRWRFGAMRATWRVFTAVFGALFARDAAAQFTAPRAALVEEMRIDGAREDLTNIGFVFVRSDGSIAIDQPQDFQVRFYDAAGKLLGKFGRKGSGPGEFGVSSGWTPPQSSLRGGMYGDTLWVYDLTQRRFTLLSPQGKFIRSVRLPSGLPSLGEDDHTQKATARRTMLSFVPLAFYGDGNMLGSANFGTIETLHRSDGSSTLRQAGSETAFILTSKGAVAKSVANPPPYQGNIQIEWNNGLTSMGVGIPFFAYPAQDVAPDGVRFAFLTTITSTSGSTVRLTTIQSNGDTLLSRAYPFAGRPVTKTSADSAINATMASRRTPARGARSMSYPPGVLDELESKLRASMPAVYPAINAVRLGLDETIWLGAPATREGREYIRLDSKGEPSASVMIPRSARFLHASRTMVWAIIYDSDDLPSVVRYRIEEKR